MCHYHVPDFTGAATEASTCCWIGLDPASMRRLRHWRSRCVLEEIARAKTSLKRWRFKRLWPWTVPAIPRPSDPPATARPCSTMTATDGPVPSAALPGTRTAAWRWGRCGRALGAGAPCWPPVPCHLPAANDCRGSGRCHPFQACTAKLPPRPAFYHGLSCRLLMVWSFGCSDLRRHLPAPTCSTPCWRRASASAECKAGCVGKTSGS